MMNRRRFIAVSAAALAASRANASPVRWHGRAMGADVSLVLHDGTDSDLAAAIEEIRAIEARFSIYSPTSELSQINAGGGGVLSDQMSELLQLCDLLHRATGGLFDPTIQPAFHALLEGRDPPWDRVGWNQIHLGQGQLRLGEGQALTLNGIAQGYATDRVRAVLQDRGFTKALVSVGEQAAIGGPFRLSLDDPSHGRVGMRTLSNQAIATSSPSAMIVGGLAHIIDPVMRSSPRWSTVSIEAKTAALADGLSTALCLAPLAQIERIVRETGTRATLVDNEGDVTTIT